GCPHRFILVRRCYVRNDDRNPAFPRGHFGDHLRCPAEPPARILPELQCAVASGARPDYSQESAKESRAALLLSCRLENRFGSGSRRIRGQRRSLVSFNLRESAALAGSSAL